MQFKLGKCWSPTSSKVLFGAALAACAILPCLSWATITVVSVTAGDNQLFNAYGGGFYYPAFATGLVSTFGVIDSGGGFNFVDLATTADINQQAGFGSAEGQNPGIVYFNITSNHSFSSAPGAVAALVAENPNVGTTQFLVPIASVGSTICGNDNGQSCILGAAHGSSFGRKLLFCGCLQQRQHHSDRVESTGNLQ